MNYKMYVGLVVCLISGGISAETLDKGQPDHFQEMLLESVFYQDLEKIKPFLPLDRQREIHGGNLSLEELALVIDVASQREETELVRMGLSKAQYLEDLYQARAFLTEQGRSKK